MNISFYDGINDGKFFNISAGKYDDLDDIDDINMDDINISEEIEDEEDGLPCEDCECPGLEEVKNEISTHLAMINKANMRLNQLGNKISDLKEFRDETYELQYGQLLDRLNLIEKKIDAFKCIDILDKVTKLEEKVEKLEGKCLTNHNSNKLAIGRLYERLGKVEPKLAATAQIVEDRVCTIDTINGTISGYDYAILSDRINELESKLEKLSPVEPTPIYYDNELKYFTTPGCAKGEIHDSVNHPSHYTDGKYETIDFIEEYGTITHIGNAIKYASRAGKKDEDAYIEDLKKGLWYLHRYNCPPKKKHIDVLDYCKEKKLPDELTNVLIAISRENYVEAERVLRKYIEELKK